MGIVVERAAASRLPELDLAGVPFGSVFSDHMLVAEYRDGRWGDAAIRPYGPLPLPPSISALHYGISVFEGLKAHRSPAGAPLLFRARDNARRLQRSARRLTLPEPPEALFLDGLRELVRLDRAWIPPAGQGALYIRPLLFSVDPSLRVAPAERCLFVVMTSPFGAYFAEPVDVLVCDRYVRAFPGGTGDVKPAGNYGAALLADREARDAGFGAVLWLDALERSYVEECGVMNVFFVTPDAVVTPELSGTILPGITRDSVIALLRDAGRRVEERRVPLRELFERHARGELLECFGTGTAATLVQVGRVRHGERELALPPLEARRVGPALRDALVGIMTGRAPDRHGWVEAIE
jgi:branched-chain amino acid aminotransferase